MKNKILIYIGVGILIVILGYFIVKRFFRKKVKEFTMQTPEISGEVKESDFEQHYNNPNFYSKYIENNKSNLSRFLRWIRKRINEKVMPFFSQNSEEEEVKEGFMSWVDQMLIAYEKNPSRINELYNTTDDLIASVIADVLWFPYLQPGINPNSDSSKHIMQSTKPMKPNTFNALFDYVNSHGLLGASGHKRTYLRGYSVWLNYKQQSNNQQSNNTQ
jgi:hypothetical protein